jgi:hypothetical protein
MPWRNTGTGQFERTRPDPTSRDYVAGPGIIELLRSWYEDGGYYTARMERAYGKAPDDWRVLEESEEDGRTSLLICHRVTDACVHVGFRDDGGVPRELELRPLPPEQAYARLLAEDEKTRASP